MYNSAILCWSLLQYIIGVEHEWEAGITHTTTQPSYKLLQIVQIFEVCHHNIHSY